MARNNLRIVYKNLVDLQQCSITASSSQSAATPTTNLKKDAKGLVWRSSPTTVGSSSCKAIILLDLGGLQKIGGVALPYTNLNSALATIKVTGYTVAPTLGGTVNAPTIVGAVVGGFTQTTLCCPWNTLSNPSWGTNPVGANSYAYGGGVAARIWLDAAIQALQARYIGIEITDYYTTPGTVTNTAGGTTVTGTNTTFLSTFKVGDQLSIAAGPAATITAILSDTSMTTSTIASANTGAAYLPVGKYIEASRVVCGQYWTPKYNTQYGLTSTIKDLSTHERTESGDLVSKRGPRYNHLTFDLKWLDQVDRVDVTKLFLGNGLPKPMFVSLFPDNTSSGLAIDYEKERAHQIYAKMMQVPGVQYSTLDMYSMQLELEEV